MTTFIEVTATALIGAVLLPIFVYVTTKLAVVAFYRGRRIAKDLDDKQENERHGKRS